MNIGNKTLRQNPYKIYIEKDITREHIEKLVNEWVNNNLKFFTFREHQLEYIVDIIYSILHNNHVNLVEAPTGSGKSIMVIIMA